MPVGILIVKSGYGISTVVSVSRSYRGIMLMYCQSPSVQMVGFLLVLIGTRQSGYGISKVVFASKP